MKKMLQLFALTCLFTISQAGVVIYAPIPQEAHEFIEFLKNRVKEKVELINKKQTEITQSPLKRAYYFLARLFFKRMSIEEGTFVFDGGKYPPHLTLMYGDEKLSMKELTKKEPTLNATLGTISQNASPLDITDSLQNAEIDSFQSNPNDPKEINGKKYKNFKVLIIHLAKHPELIDLAHQLRTTIEQTHPGFKLSDLQFNSHLTIGWLFNEHDINPELLTKRLAEELKTDIEKYIRESKNPFIVKSFVLSTHDKQKKEFELKKELKNRNASAAA